MFKLKAILPYSLALLLVAGSLFSACNEDNNEDDASNKIDSTLLKDPTIVKINNRLFSIPSPFQVTMLVKDLKVPFNKDLLNPVHNQSGYSTTFQQALNLGIYGLLNSLNLIIYFQD